MKKYLIIATILAIGLITADASAQATQRVKFAKGTTSASVKGTVRGYAYIDYLVGALGGQLISVNVKGSNASTVMTVTGADGKALPDASMVTEFSGSLPADGDYRIRVAMMRSAARRAGSRSDFTLSIAIQ